MRVNKYTPGQLTLDATVDQGDRRVRGKGYKPRARGKNEATPPSNDLWVRGDYRLGDGDYTHQPVRPGADQHLQYKSLATAGTVTYPRSHK